MSSTTFLLILAGVIIVLVGFLAKAWKELSNVNRHRRNSKPRDRDDT